METHDRDTAPQKDGVTGKATKGSHSFPLAVKKDTYLYLSSGKGLSQYLTDVSCRQFKNLKSFLVLAPIKVV